MGLGFLIKQREDLYMVGKTELEEGVWPGSLSTLKTFLAFGWSEPRVEQE